MRRPIVAITLALWSLGVACSGLATDLFPAAAVYPLDGLSRSLAAGEKLPCQTGELTLISYRGEQLRYQRPVRVHPAFKPQLAAFEHIVVELSRQHFGRAPRLLLHFGAYACRPMRRHAYWASEHAFGNALDLAGFEFGPLPRGAPAPQGLAKPLHRGFAVRVDRHWEGSGNDAAKSAFLHALAERLMERPDVFRSLVGPGFAGHDNHFHLAHPPYRLVRIGAVQRWWFW